MIRSSMEAPRDNPALRELFAQLRGAAGVA